MNKTNWKGRRGGTSFFPNISEDQAKRREGEKL
jgi:hypothetical protein